MPPHDSVCLDSDFELRMPKMDLHPKVCGRMGINFGKATSGKLECACDVHGSQVRLKRTTLG